jgi:hypothetical protein
MSETNYGAYDQDGAEAGLPRWRRATRALLRMSLIALVVMLAGHCVFPL